MTKGSDILVPPYPPWRARTISMLSPALSAVSPQAARGTTEPLSATAMPRWPVSTAFSASKAASVGTVRTSSWPLIRIRASTAACVMVCTLLGSLGRGKALDPERPDRRLDGAVEHQPGDRVGRDRRQQDAIAVVAGCVDQPVDRPGPEDRRVVTAARAMADPHLLDRQLFHGGHYPP